VVLWSAFQASRAGDAKAGAGSEVGAGYAIMRGCIRRWAARTALQPRT